LKAVERLNMAEYLLNASRLVSVAFSLRAAGCDCSPSKSPMLLIEIVNNATHTTPLTRFRRHEPVLGASGSRRRLVLDAREALQVQDRKVFGCEGDRK
jgi:hypothetical protein